MRRVVLASAGLITILTAVTPGAAAARDSQPSDAVVEQVIASSHEASPAPARAPGRHRAGLQNQPFTPHS